MMSTATRIDALRRQAAARHARRAAYARQERERVDAMTDGQLLRNLARLQFVYQLTQGAPDFGLCGRVDALITAGDVDGAWALLGKRQSLINEVRQ